MDVGPQCFLRTAALTETGEEHMVTKTKTAEHHVKAAHHYEAAARHHKEAAKSSEASKPEIAAHHSVIAAAHTAHAQEAATSACKEHATASTPILKAV